MTSHLNTQCFDPFPFCLFKARIYIISRACSVLLFYLFMLISIVHLPMLGNPPRHPVLEVSIFSFRHREMQAAIGSISIFCNACRRHLSITCPRREDQSPQYQSNERISPIPQLSLLASSCAENSGPIWNGIWTDKLLWWRRTRRTSCGRISFVFVTILSYIC